MQLLLTKIKNFLFTFYLFIFIKIEKFINLT